MLYIENVPSPVGKLYIAADDTALCGLWIEGQMYFMQSISKPVARSTNPVIEDTIEWLNSYFNGAAPSPSTLPLMPQGSSFRQAVWKRLCEIPYGKVITYGTLAKQIAADLGLERMSAQAIGGAVGHNPISIVVPCHRVIGANGSLTGYAGGVEKKEFLLRHEGYLE